MTFHRPIFSRTPTSCDTDVLIRQSQFYPRTRSAVGGGRNKVYHVSALAEWNNIWLALSLLSLI